MCVCVCACVNVTVCVCVNVCVCAVAAGGMFAATTCAVANIRGGKDDPFNHFCAGLATGSVFGTACK